MSTAELARTARFYRDVAAPREDRRADDYAARTATVPARIQLGPCPAYPDGWVCYPRRNLAAAARAARRRAATFRTLAATLEALLAGRPA
jgi:hypothetical protein